MMMLDMDKSATELAALMREQDAFDRGMKVRVSELRDQFAMAALTGLCADSGTAGETTAKMAKTAYALADAMLAARGGK